MNYETRENIRFVCGLFLGGISVIAEIILFGVILGLLANYLFVWVAIVMFFCFAVPFIFLLISTVYYIMEWVR